jgi:hypothetical protein
MRVVGLSILKCLLLRLWSATLMMTLVAGQSTLLLPPDATDHLLACLPPSPILTGDIELNRSPECLCPARLPTPEMNQPRECSLVEPFASLERNAT